MKSHDIVYVHFSTKRKRMLLSWKPTRRPEKKQGNCPAGEYDYPCRLQWVRQRDCCARYLRYMRVNARYHLGEWGCWLHEKRDDRNFGDRYAPCCYATLSARGVNILFDNFRGDAHLAPSPPRPDRGAHYGEPYRWRPNFSPIRQGGGQGGWHNTPQSLAAWRGEFGAPAASPLYAFHLCDAGSIDPNNVDSNG